MLFCQHLNYQPEHLLRFFNVRSKFTVPKTSLICSEEVQVSWSVLGMYMPFISTTMGISRKNLFPIFWFSVLNQTKLCLIFLLCVYACICALHYTWLWGEDFQSIWIIHHPHYFVFNSVYHENCLWIKPQSLIIFTLHYWFLEIFANKIYSWNIKLLNRALNLLILS